MGAAEWAALAAIASAVSASVSLCVSIFTGRSAAAQIKLADFNTCLEVVKQLAEAQRKARDADTAGKKLFEVRELLNLMEALALLINHGKVTPTTKHYAEHFLIEAWAWLSADTAMVELMQSSITSPSTYAELMKFAKKRKVKIEQQTTLLKKQKAEVRDVNAG